jgi:formate-dependent nitrite reductase cytochrome c552 subunit
MRTLVLRAVLALSATWASGALAYDFLGSESCQGCHPDAYAAWQASPHARSRDVLSAQQQKDARCLSCHSPNEADQRAMQVACESCHGGGQYYSARYVMKDAELARLVGLVDPVEKACRACHDDSSPSLKPFDFAVALKAMDHWTVEREKRGAAKAKTGAAAPRRFEVFGRLLAAAR